MLSPVVGAATDPSPWWESSLLGVVVGAVLVALLGFLQAKHSASVESKKEVLRFAHEADENRYGDRRQAIVDFWAAVTNYKVRSEAWEQQYGVMPGDDPSIGNPGPPDQELQRLFMPLRLLGSPGLAKAAEDFLETHYHYVYGRGLSTPDKSWVDQEAWHAAEETMLAAAREDLGISHEPDMGPSAAS